MDYDDAYANRDYIPDADRYLEAWPEEAGEFRKLEEALGRARLNIAYGDALRQKLDLFLPQGKPRGLVVFFHGGYWRAFDRSYWSHFAAGATGRGWAMALPSYTLAPEARIAAITREARAALLHAAGLVRGPVVVCGHSAGGHLAARLGCTDVDLPEPVAARLQRILPISPLSDLRPLRHTAMNSDLCLDEEEARSESPLLCRARPVPMTVWVGAEERPAFLDQARWLAEARPDARLHIAPGRHHFDVIDPLKDPESDLIAELLEPAPGRAAG